MNQWLRDNVVMLIRQYGIDSFASLAQEAIVPVGIMGVIAVIIFGFRCYHGNALVGDFLKTAGMVLIIPMLALSYHNFAGSVLGFIDDTTDQIGRSVASAAGVEGSYTSVAEALDTQFERTNELAAQMGGAGQSFFSMPDFGAAFMSILISIGSLAFLLIGAVYFLSSAVLSFFVAIGPPMVLLYYMPWTRGMVAGWLRNSLAWTLLPIFLVLIVGGMAGFVEAASSEFVYGQGVSFKMVGQWFAMVIVMCLLTLVCKNFANGIAGGLTLDGGREMHFAASRGSHWLGRLWHIGAGAGLGMTGRARQSFSNATSSASTAWHASSAGQRVNQLLSMQMGRALPRPS